MFLAGGAMTLYVLYHNERFLIEPTNPIWRHYAEIAFWLVPHAVAGTCALFLAPLQFSERLRTRYTTAHHVIGRVYVIGALVLAPRRSGRAWRCRWYSRSSPTVSAISG